MKRRTYLILIQATILVGLFAGAALAVTASGTDQDDSINGTNAADIIGARGGDDVVRGLRGSDRLMATLAGIGSLAVWARMSYMAVTAMTHSIVRMMDPRETTGTWSIAATEATSLPLTLGTA